MLLALVLVNYFNQRSVAAPIADVRSIGDISPSCDKLGDCRTLLSIVSSCIATIVACVWTAVHPDIPPYGEDPWFQKLRRIWFTISAIIASEIYIYIAACQYLKARKISQMNEFKEHGWTTTHGFFVLMGGFELCNPSTHSTEQLNADDLINLINSNKMDFLYISEVEIQDKSKANWLSKTAAVVQTFWFMLQVLVRFIEGLPITELEIFTASFTIMAIAMYALWLRKPFCIDVPIVLHKQPKAITVAMDTPGNIANVADAPNLNGIVEEGDCSYDEFELGLWDSDLRRFTKVQSHPGPRTSGHCHSVQLEERTCLQNLLHPLKVVWNAACEFIRNKYHKRIENIRGTKNLFYRGLLYAVLAVILLLSIIIRGPVRFIFGQPRREDWWHAASIGSHNGFDFSIFRSVFNASCVVAVPAMIFGTIHCTAWFSDFPTVIEQYLWRILSLVITCSPALEVSIFFIMTRSTGTAIVVLGTFSGLVIPLLYVVSRLILLVLAFTTLRALPPGAYKAISWVEFIPHL
ncbi:uncharacterized protein LAESUDRAFT_727343 [Laetiporus sulphureus 93-53]|uniref:Uncharacterized protein n=1 Tax=Laetiporus sulphureus 93-53 TaxID=1314785 RepID=A0A165DKM7_9APHY|nr:uncharacterized protein LAESUDRAFT_727343 [Laetiporus sulphureus 93-53]KZT05092.1 hypothetical protein LAESUDRAFT_727343 [Laetiporus sulphureus 93-53]